MKSLFSFFIVCLMMVAMAAQAHPDEVQYAQSSSDTCLVVWQKDGSVVLFNLTETPKVTYKADKVIVTASSVVEFKFQAISKMTYDLPTVDVKWPTQKAERPFRNNGETITFLPADKDMHVKIVLVSGMVVKEFVVRKDDTYTLSLMAFPDKLYLVNVNGVTYKIMVR